VADVFTGPRRVTNSETQAVIPGARVELSGPTGAAVLTENNGEYAFAALPEGLYSVRTSAAGYDGDTQTKVVPLDTIAFLSVALTPGAVDPPTEPTDINGDYSVDAVDVQLVINAVLGLDIGALIADVNDDASTDAVDVQIVINSVLGV
jgi:hypothetical protein